MNRQKAGTCRTVLMFVLACMVLADCGGDGTGTVAPTATTDGASSFTVSSATLNASFNPNGAETSAWFEWGTDPNLRDPASTTKKSFGAGITVQSGSETITGLSQGTTYYYRVVAQNAGGTTKGAIVRFNTLAIHFIPADRKSTSCA